MAEEDKKDVIVGEEKGGHLSPERCEACEKYTYDLCYGHPVCFECTTKSPEVRQAVDIYYQSDRYADLTLGEFLDRLFEEK